MSFELRTDNTRTSFEKRFMYRPFGCSISLGRSILAILVAVMAIDFLCLWSQSAETEIGSPPRWLEPSCLEIQS